MSLARFCHERCVALAPEDTVAVAARAMASNHIGAIAVFARGRVVGMLTDRDLALRVVGEARRPDTPIGDVMTALPATLDVDDDPEDALEVMRDLCVRRVPVLEGGRLVGMVTVDDLLLSRDVPIARIAEVVEAQLAEPAPRKPAGAVHPVRTSRRIDERAARRRQRHEARAANTLRRFTDRLCDVLGTGDADLALEAFEVVAEAIVRRIGPAEASDFVSQLPSVIKERLLDLPAGPARRIDRRAIELEMRRRLGLDADHARSLVHAISDALPEVVSAGELLQVQAQLPVPLKSLIPVEGRAGI